MSLRKNSIKDNKKIKQMMGEGFPGNKIKQYRNNIIEERKMTHNQNQGVFTSLSL